MIQRENALDIALVGPALGIEQGLMKLKQAVAQLRQTSSRAIRERIERQHADIVNLCKPRSALAKASYTEELPLYRSRARNTAAQSENKIHDDRVAAQYGFRGGLVPGVTVYGYMASAVVQELSLEWLARGSMQIRFRQPFYESDEVQVVTQASGGCLEVTASQQDGTVCATGSATLDSQLIWTDDLAEHPLPDPADRPQPARDSFSPGAPLGTLRITLDLTDTAFLESLGFDTQAEPAAIYRGPDGAAHPAMLLGLANRVFVRNFLLGPWIHVSSDLTNFGVARHGDQITVKGRIQDCFERKGHELVALDLSLSANDNRPIQIVRHTAIYRPRME